MGEIPRKADGRRIFSVEFKREAVGRVTSGERTLLGQQILNNLRKGK